jgi:hypothetical protein
MASPSVNYGFGFNGYLFGGVGQQVQVLSVQGLDSLSQVRSQDDIRGYTDGMFTGRDFAGGREITFELQIMGDNTNSAQYYVNQMRSYFLMQQYGTSVLEFLLPSRSLQYVNARVRARDITINPEYTFGRALATVKMFCPDPRIYDSTTQSQSIVTPSLATGRVYNRIYNLLYSSGAGASSVNCVNSGTYLTYPTFTVVGPVSNPTIYNSTTGQSIATTAVLATGDQLIINPDLRTITLNGVNARNLLINTSQWFGFPVGTTKISYVGSTGSGGLTIQWHNAYL